MKHVRVTLDPGEHAADVHPMFDLLVNAPFVERATAIQWTFSGEEMGFMHHVVGDTAAFEAAISEVPQVLDYDLTTAGQGFYVYIRDATTPPMRAMFEHVVDQPVVVVPPLRYGDDGVTFSAFGPAAALQAAIESVPDPLSVSVSAVGGLAAVPGVLGSRLSERQRAAAAAAVELGYYDVPRTASHEDVAAAIDCAPSTAAEHLRKAEATLLRSVLGE